VLAHLEVRAGVGVAVSDRHGGVSAGRWRSLNLADHVGDDPVAVAENRRRFRMALGDTAGDLVTMRQVHGPGVAVVDSMPAVPPEADALVSRTRGLALVVLVADCTPLLLADRRAGVIAAVHVGRQGLAAGVVGQAVAAMTGLGADVTRIDVVVGPAVCPRDYEVPQVMRDEVAAVAPDAAATTRTGAAALDIRQGLVGQLERLGVTTATQLAGCTAEDSRFYSYRRDGVTGRFAGAVWLS
jgi:YfiH family protein